MMLLVAFQGCLEVFVFLGDVRVTSTWALISVSLVWSGACLAFWAETELILASHITEEGYHRSLGILAHIQALIS